MKKIYSILSKLPFYVWDIKQGGNRLSEYRRLKNLEYSSPEELAKYQNVKLKNLLTHACNTSQWYRDLSLQFDLEFKYLVNTEILVNFPVTTKKDIRNNINKFISNRYSKESLCTAKTGGSTGTALDLYFDKYCQQLRNAAQMYADDLAGWEIGSKCAAIWGNPPTPSNKYEKLKDLLLTKTIFLDTMNINKSNVELFIVSWNNFKPNVLFGHAHSIYILAKYIRKYRLIPTKIKGIISTSMALIDHERALIEEVFGVKVTNRYGCEEVGLIAVECEEHDGLHINSPHIILEVVDYEGRTLPPGKVGRLVVTDLNNYGMPLIRYCTEDIGVLSFKSCKCGRTYPLLERIEGRVADYLYTLSGDQVSGISLIERTLTKVKGIEQMQIIQEKKDRIVINRVKGKEFCNDTDSALIREFLDIFGKNVDFVISDVNEILQEKNGKYRFSICQI